MEIIIRYGDKTLTAFHYEKLTLSDEEVEQAQKLIDAHHRILKQRAEKRGTDTNSVPRPSLTETIWWLNNDERNCERRWYYRKFSPQVTTESGDLVALVEQVSAVDGIVERGSYIDPADEIVDKIVNRQRELDLWDAVAKLQPQQRKLIHDLFVAELPASQLAQNEGVIPAAISRRKSRALAQLRQLLQN